MLCKLLEAGVPIIGYFHRKIEHVSLLESVGFSASASLESSCVFNGGIVYRRRRKAEDFEDLFRFVCRNLCQPRTSSFLFLGENAMPEGLGKCCDTVFAPKEVFLPENPGTFYECEREDGVWRAFLDFGEAILRSLARRNNGSSRPGPAPYRRRDDEWAHDPEAEDIVWQAPSDCEDDEEEVLLSETDQVGDGGLSIDDHAKVLRWREALDGEGGEP
jgi:hypothetical protein